MFIMLTLCMTVLCCEPLEFKVNKIMATIRKEKICILSWHWSLHIVLLCLIWIYPSYSQILPDNHFTSTILLRDLDHLWFWLSSFLALSWAFTLTIINYVVSSLDRPQSLCYIISLSTRCKMLCSTFCHFRMLSFNSVIILVKVTKK